jgi:hypothetical protein
MESRHINPGSHSWGGRGHVKGIILYHSFAFHRRVRDNIHHLVSKAGYRRFGNSNAPQDKGLFFLNVPYPNWPGFNQSFHDLAISCTATIELSHKLYFNVVVAGCLSFDTPAPPAFSRLFIESSQSGK